jgi:transketolase
MHAAVKTATKHVGPVFLRSSRVAMPHIYENGIKFEIGKANVLRQGSDVSIIAAGLMVPMALDAAAYLAEEAITARVIDLHTIRPLDIETITAAARETSAVVTAEEHLLHGGMGSNVARIISEHHPVPMRFVGLKDAYVESGDPLDLLKKYHMTTEDIIRAVKQVTEAKSMKIAA